MSSKPKDSERTLNMMRTRTLENYYELERQENESLSNADQEIQTEREQWLAKI